MGTHTPESRARFNAKRRAASMAARGKAGEDFVDGRHAVPELGTLTGEQKRLRVNALQRANYSQKTHGVTLEVLPEPIDEDSDTYYNPPCMCGAFEGVPCALHDKGYITNEVGLMLGGFLALLAKG